MSLAQGNTTPTRPRIEPGSPDPESDAREQEYINPRVYCSSGKLSKVDSRDRVLSLARLYKVQVELLYSLWRLRSRHATFKFCLSPYLNNHSSETFQIWSMDTLEGLLSIHESRPKGPCWGVGPEVKN